VWVMWKDASHAVKQIRPFRVDGNMRGCFVIEGAAAPERVLPLPTKYEPWGLWGVRGNGRRVFHLP